MFIIDYALGTYPGARRTNYSPIMAYSYRNAFASNNLCVCADFIFAGREMRSDKISTCATKIVGAHYSVRWLVSEILQGRCQTFVTARYSFTVLIFD